MNLHVFTINNYVGCHYKLSSLLTFLGFINFYWLYILFKSSIRIIDLNIANFILHSNIESLSGLSVPVPAMFQLRELCLSD
jgi:hypothetical protein